MTLPHLFRSARLPRGRLHEIGDLCDCLGDVECVLACCARDEEEPGRWVMRGAGGDMPAPAPARGAEDERPHPGDAAAKRSG